MVSVKKIMDTCMCRFDCVTVVGDREGWARKSVDHISWMAVLFKLTDRSRFVIVV